MARVINIGRLIFYLNEVIMAVPKGFNAIMTMVLYSQHSRSKTDTKTDLIKG